MTELGVIRGYGQLPTRPSFRLSDTGCWEWQGSRGAGGYSTIRHQGRRLGAHRAFYEHAFGPIPNGLQLDHVCRNPSCVNPDHLGPVTPKENQMRGIRPANLRRARMSSCGSTTPEQRESAVRALAAGANGAEIARQLGVCKNSVYAWAKVRGVKHGR